MTASTPRQLLLTALADSGLAAYQLIPYARDPGALTAPTIMVRVDQVDPGPSQLTRRYTAALVLLTPRTDPTGRADDELDQLLEDVLHAIDLSPLGVVWTRARRATYRAGDIPTWPAYEITLTVDTTHGR